MRKRKGPPPEILKKSGPHGKTRKAERKKDKQKLDKDLNKE